MEPLNSKEILVYVGSYAPSSAEGLHTYRLNPETGSLSWQQSVSGIANPSFLALHPNQNRLYAVSEVGAADGKVASYTVAPDGSLTQLNEQSSLGRATCHLSVNSAATCLVVAHYTSGNITAFPVDAEGRVGEAAVNIQHEGSSVRADRQQEPHPHSANLSPDQRFVYVPDLGLDQIKVYALNGGDCRRELRHETPIHPGAGPRHMAFHPSIPFAYVINELDSTITALAYNAEDGALNAVQTVPALPEDFTGSSSCADIHIAPTGHFLYGSNRGHDSIVVYRINQADGTLSYVEHVSTGGRTPRNFALTPDGRFLLAANQESNSIVTFAIDAETGRLQRTEHEVTVTKPVCIKFLQR
jgi:6-phosphogluconolactonase